MMFKNLSKLRGLFSQKSTLPAKILICFFSFFEKCNPPIEFHHFVIQNSKPLVLFKQNNENVCFYYVLQYFWTNFSSKTAPLSTPQTTVSNFAKKHKVHLFNLGGRTKAFLLTGPFLEHRFRNPPQLISPPQGKVKVTVMGP